VTGPRVRMFPYLVTLRTTRCSVIASAWRIRQQLYVSAKRGFQRFLVGVAWFVGVVEL